MTVVSIILGVLLIIAGFSCMATPLTTFLSVGYYLTILLFVYGIFGIIRFFRKQAGGLELIVSILAVIVGFVALFRPGETAGRGDVLAIDRLILYLIAGWLFVQGCVSVILSVQTRALNRNWGWGVVVGVLGIIAGIYSFAHPALTAVTTGILIGFYFVQSGCDLIILGSAVGAVKDAVSEAEKSE